MNILLTGAFGNVGKSTLEQLLKTKHDITTFDLPTKRNISVSNHYSNRYKKNNTKATTSKTIANNGSYTPLWGDIRNYDDVASAIDGKDVVIHAAAIIPPAADRNPSLAYQVNVNGTRNIINAILAQGKDNTRLEVSGPNIPRHNMPRLIYTSSVALYGDRVKDPYIKIDDPLTPNSDDEYAKQKLLCEQMIMEAGETSGLEWIIMRLSFILSPEMLKLDPLMFNMPLNTSLEPCHTKDAGLALANAAIHPYPTTLNHKIFHIAGGKKSRLTYGEYLDKIMSFFGFNKRYGSKDVFLPESAFRHEGYHCGFMDTEESEALLNYQQHTMEDHYEEVRQSFKAMRFFVKFSGPLGKLIARDILLNKSPYYPLNKQNVQKNIKDKLDDRKNHTGSLPKTIAKPIEPTTYI